ncbi:MAG: methyltransferase type 11 [Methylocystaceae bacterium]|nr:MAG: methyltransferase type 11 [Methylocystaceae bacterium]
MILLNFVKLSLRSVNFRLRNVTSTTINDYDAAAATYDDYYSRYLGKAGSTLTEKLPLKAGDTIIDLACGTGFFSHEIAAAVGEKGQVFAVDLSPKMLARNRENAAAKHLSNIEFIESDALEWLKGQPSGAADGIVCGWGVCYMNHTLLRNEIERVLRPGGFFGIIENRACSLQAVSDLFRDALLEHPEALAKNMSISLPPDEKYLVKTFSKGMLTRVDSWNGEIVVPCKTGEEVAEYMLRSGASAGFIDALDQTHFETMWSEFVKKADQRIARRGEVPVKHEYCVLIGRKKTSS